MNLLPINQAMEGKALQTLALVWLVLKPYNPVSTNKYTEAIELLKTYF